MMMELTINDSDVMIQDENSNNKMKIKLMINYDMIINNGIWRGL